MPAQVVNVAENDAWISAVLGGLLVLFLWILLIKLSLYYKNETVIEYLPKIYGKFIGNIIIIILIIYFIVTVSFVSKFFSDMARLFLLPNTPSWAILLLFWIVVAYWAHFGIRVIAITMTIIFIPTFLNVAGFLFIPLNRMRFEQILPVMGEGIKPVLSGAYKFIFFYFGAASLFFIFPVLKKPDKAYKVITLAFIINAVVYALIIIILIARFSTNEIKNMVAPVVTLMKTLQLPGAFLERMDVLFLTVFMATSIDDAALYLYLCVLSVVRWTKKKYYKLYIIIAAVLGYIGALIPLSPAKIDELYNYFKHTGLFFIALVFPIGLLITIIKKRRGNL